jgi:predicted alpha/beta hydrolase family esterase
LEERPDFKRIIMKFIIFHGSFGTPEENWFTWLKKELEKLGQEAFVPKFPVDDWEKVTEIGKQKAENWKGNQTLDNWMKTFKKKVLPKIKKKEKLCFIGHSLAPVFILHVVDKYNLKLDCAIFVSPFMEDIGGKWYQFYAVNKTFYKNDFNFDNLKKLIPNSYVLYGDNDPYVSSKFPKDFATKLNSKILKIKGGGHLNSEFGYTRFPMILELCKKIL